MAWYQHWVFNQPQVVVKLHAILRPFLLRRLKNDVEQMLPRKKEIILYATLTEHQKKFQDHLINKTLEGYLREKMDTGIRLFSIDFLLILNQA
jgi:ATP-dependent DNA helicase